MDAVLFFIAKSARLWDNGYSKFVWGGGLSEHQNFKTDSESNSKKKLTGLGGWLSFIQAAMVFALLSTIVLLIENLEYEYFLKAAGLLLILIFVVLAILRFYQYKRDFRLYLLASVVLFIIYYFTLSDNAQLKFSEKWQVLIAFILILTPVIALFFSKRVKDTFCEQAKQTIHETKLKNPPVGIDGWLVLFQLNMIVILMNLVNKIVQSVMEERLVSIITANAAIAVILVMLCAVLFYKRRMLFRKVYIYAVSFVVVNTILELIPFHISHNNELIFALEVVASGFIIGALYRSERVKNTFK